MIIKKIKNLNLEEIAESGQIFRMNKNKDNSFNIISKDKFLKVKEAKSGEFHFYCERKEFENYWKNFFDLETDYSKILSLIDKNDKFLYEASKAGSGIRILRQDLFETIISFIISQQNNIPKIKNTIEKLCKKFGELKEDKETGCKFFAFPKAKDLRNIKDLQGLSFRISR
ncbi:MAG: DNA glycosylase [Bdellovibrionota bacterium]